MTEETKTEVDARRHGIMRKIQALLDKASNTPYDEEADAFRQKADELMTSYVITSWELDRLKPKEQREEVTSRFFTVCSGDHVAKDGFMRLASALIVHCRGRALHYDFQSKTMEYKVRIWAFPSDLDYFEMLWTSLLLQLTKEMSPQMDPNMSFEENLTRLKESGMKWQDAHRVLQPGVPWERKHGVRYTKIYTDFCKDRGRERIYTSPTTFVRNFVEGFASKVDERLWEIKKHRQKMEEAHGPGTALVLVDRKKEVDEAYAAVPKGRSIRVADKKIDPAAFQHGQRAGARADLGQTRVGRKRELG